uniref:SCAN box domain-containing protein n=1 Tax=Sander lucioperca TaxID=283035 RepID=A0A8C9ZEW1_SANLU
PVASPPLQWVDIVPPNPPLPPQLEQRENGLQMPLEPTGYEINRETYRQRFRSYDTPAEVSPPRTWVQYDTCSKEEMMEKMVLEQYLKVLYPEVKAWVKERDPTTLRALRVWMDPSSIVPWREIEQNLTGSLTVDFHWMRNVCGPAPLRNGSVLRRLSIPTRSGFVAAWLQP